VLLRIFIGESDRFKHQPLDEAIILRTREMHLAGATVLRGPIEIAESEQKIQAFLPILDEMIEGGLVTMETVQALHYRGIKKE